jgi:hypothetical protein
VIEYSLYRGRAPKLDVESLLQLLDAVFETGDPLGGGVELAVPAEQAEYKGSD